MRITLPNLPVAVGPDGALRWPDGTALEIWLLPNDAPANYTGPVQKFRLVVTP